MKYQNKLNRRLENEMAALNYWSFFKLKVRSCKGKIEEIKTILEILSDIEKGKQKLYRYATAATVLGEDSSFNACTRNYRSTWKTCK